MAAGNIVPTVTYGSEIWITTKKKDTGQHHEENSEKHLQPDQAKYSPQKHRIFYYKRITNTESQFNLTRTAFEDPNGLWMKQLTATFEKTDIDQETLMNSTRPKPKPMSTKN